MHGAAFFASGRGGAEEKSFGVGQGGAGKKSSGQGGVTVKLGAFSGPGRTGAAIFLWAGAWRASLVICDL